MKELLCIMVLLLFLGSCERKEALFTAANIKERAKNCEVFEDFTVPVKEGYTTFVTFNKDTLAVTNESITIKIPKGSDLGTKSGDNGLNIDFGVVQADKIYSSYWQAIMFEDSEKGDYDYNDLIIHVRNECQRPSNQNYNLQNISIQPIALGSIKQIKLGCILADKSIHIISENVRKDLFEGQKGYINTETDKAPHWYSLKETLMNHQLPKNVNSSIAWFIEVDGKTYYAVGTALNYNDYAIFNNEGMPYGLVAYSTFSYPEENVSIHKAYPGFQDWISNGTPNIGASVSKFCCKHASIPFICPDGVTRSLWNYNKN